MVMSLCGRCVMCHKVILPGDMVVNSSDGWCHEQCFRVWFDTVGCHAKTQDNLDMTEGGKKSSPC